nr:GntR family transcriptional regulator [Rhizobium sp. TCK]
MNAKPMLKVERPSKTLRELALESLRDGITAGHFKPGDRLVERDLCDQLGVSRTIVREVLRHLESEGLVTTLANRGPIVATLDIEEARQIYEIRGALEGMAARLCAEHTSEAIVIGLEKSLLGIREAYRAEDMAGVLKHTNGFYHTLFSKVGRTVAWGIVNSLTVRINHLRSMTIRTENRQIEGPAQMERILEAIRDGDAPRAYQAAIDHVSRAAAIAETVLKAQAEEEQVA